MPIILSVDDDSSFQTLVKMLFEHMDVEIVSALTADAGLELTHELNPDLILMDIRLPGRAMDGWAVIAQINENPETQNIPIIVVSAAYDNNDAARASALGCVAFFKKPFNVTEFRTTVQQYL